MKGLFLTLLALTGWAAEPNWIYFTDKGEGRSPQTVRISASSAARRHASGRDQFFWIEDLSLHPRYIRLLEIEGFRIRARSRWLNAVSVEGSAAQLSNARTLQFVKVVEPVALHYDVIPDVSKSSIQRKEPIDSAYFGETYAALHLLNIPAIHNMGIFGEGAKIGFLDTGLKRDHPVFKTLKLGAEHDFITGDDIMLWDKNTSSYIPTISNYEMIQQPTVYHDWLFFIADSVEEVGASARVLYGFHRDQGAWSDTLVLSGLASMQDITRSFAVSGTDYLLLVAESGGTESGLSRRDLRWGILSGGNYEAHSTLDVNSRNPYLIDTGDTSWLFYVKDDSLVLMNLAQWDAGGVTWLGAKEVISPGGILDQPKALIATDTVVIVALDLSEGELHVVRSTDNAETFTEITSPSQAEVVAFDVEGNYLVTAEIDVSSGGFRLHVFETSDGLTWSDYAHPELFDVIDRVDLVSFNSRLHVVFESAGEIFLVSQTGSTLNSWSESEAISAEEFSYQPCAFVDTDLEVVWSRRGDDDTDYDPAEDGIDPVNENSHPAHGSRTAALAVGYQGLRYIGASPGAELYVAKTEKHVNRYGSTYELRAEEDMWIEGLEWLERQGVDIVNSSLGYGSWYTYEQRDGKTSPASRAATMAAERGVLIVNSAGNVTSREPYILPPADAEGILTAGGVDTLGNWWEQSSDNSGSAVGPTVDGRIKPDLVAPALGVYVIDVDDSTRFGFYGSGTSYAAPLLAGSAALILEVHPEYRGNPDTIITLLKQSATLASSPNDTLGWGIPDVLEAIKPLPRDIDTFFRNELLPPFPNPYHPSTQARINFPFRLNKASVRVRLSIFTLSGEKILDRELVPLTPNDVGEIPVRTYITPDDLATIGAYWDGLTESGQPAASGLYLAVLSTQYGTHASKFVLMR
ncbi:S8 family serine peptidase [candidate division WOR-3 bacterium]|nr:S8 family serine peptidase [candidate division WOR-3 bacterium]